MGHHVTVLTTYPRYNLTQQPARAYPVVAEEDGIRVIRLKTLPIHNVGDVIRGLSQLCLPLIFFWGARLGGPQDVSIVYSPPLPLGLAAYLIGRWRGTPFVLNVQDIFPQNAIDLGALRQPFLIRFFRWMEGFVYRHAGHITVHSSGNRDHIVSAGVPAGKVSVVHNWVALDEPANAEASGSIREKHGWVDRFIVFFGGVMGYAQDLDTVVECARLLRAQPQVLFLLVGDGVEKKALIRKSQDLGTTNVAFMPFVSREEYPLWVRAADVGLVTLKRSMKTPVVPSKMLDFMACCKPVLASLNAESDGIRIVDEARCGINVPAGDAAAMAEAALILLSNREACQTMGSNGRTYAKQYFSRGACVKQYEQIFLNLTKQMSQ